MAEAAKSRETAKFSIFRFGEAPSLEESGVMYAAGDSSPAMTEYYPQLQEAGYDAGHRLKLLYSAPGFSLTHVWFKSGFPLPRHSHNADCLYYIIAGSLKIGTEELAAGDGFFLGVDVPYTYVPGDQGLELLEFRTSNHFDVKMLADNMAFWTKAIRQVQNKQGPWAVEPPPTELKSA